MYKILIDSCGELPQELKEDGHFSNVALVLEVDGQQIVDDETFDQADFLSRVAKSPNAPKSACRRRTRTCRRWRETRIISIS